MEANVITNTTAEDNNQVVKLNIGGTSVYGLYKTLESSNLIKQLLQKPDTEKIFVNGDEIFIDRDPMLFTNFIVKFMRFGTVDLPPPLEEQSFYETLKEEAKFYQVEDLIDFCEEALDMTEYQKYYIMDFDSLKDLAKSRKGKTYGHYDYIDIRELTRKGSNLQLISILKSANNHFDDENEPPVLFLVRKEEI
jgi:hypothetical protein